jgi:hypothetical protein
MELQEFFYLAGLLAGTITALHVVLWTITQKKLFRDLIKTTGTSTLVLLGISVVLKYVV